MDYEGGSQIIFSSNDTPNTSLDAPNIITVNMTESDGDDVIPVDRTSRIRKKAKKSPTTSNLTSKVWDHFTKENTEGKQQARCNYCNKLYASKSSNGTSHLQRHYANKHEKKTGELRQQVLQTTFKNDKVDLSAFKFDQQNSRNELSKMIIMHEYPLSIVDHRGFRSFVNSLNPCFKIVTRNTVKKDCFKIYDIEKVAMMNILEKNEGRLAVTTDMWTSSTQKKGFMAVTAHYIDNNWKLQSRIINFIFVPSPHTSEVLCEALMHCLMDWNIDRKLSTITVDNCSTNDAMIGLILEKLSANDLLLNGVFIHMRCCAHILNLIVKEGLTVIGDAIEKVRDSVAFWTGTQKKNEKFEETARQLRLTFGKKLELDCKTRWNSTFLMLRTALEYKDVFTRLKQREPKYKCLPSELDWEVTQEICDKLEIFYTATEIFSGTKYPTANLYFAQICEIKVELMTWRNCGASIIKKMADNMCDKFESYWDTVHGIMAVATVLDPRYKLILLEFYFAKIDVERAQYEVEKILQLCCDLLRQYEDNERLKENNNNDGLEKNDSSTNRMASLSDFDAYAATRKRKQPLRSELDYYLEEDILTRESDFDILGWWKMNKGKYPILHKVARDILAIPVSTVASESAFSTSGRLISPHRSRLHPRTVEILMCAQSWLLNKEKGDKSVGLSHGTIFDDSDDDDDEITEIEH